jgi:hypothetical protein
MVVGSLLHRDGAVCSKTYHGASHGLLVALRDVLQLQQFRMTKSSYHSICIKVLLMVDYTSTTINIPHWQILSHSSCSSHQTNPSWLDRLRFQHHHNATMKQS